MIPSPFLLSKPSKRRMMSDSLNQTSRTVQKKSDAIEMGKALIFTQVEFL